MIDEIGRPRDRIVLREQKTGKEKNFPVSNTARKAIRDYLESRPEHLAHDPLFLSRKSQDGCRSQLKRAQAYKVINDAARAVGITEAVGTHTLRKTFGYWAYKEGKDITLVHRLLNHGSPSVTLAYLGITQEDLDDIYC